MNFDFLEDTYIDLDNLVLNFIVTGVTITVEGTPTHYDDLPSWLIFISTTRTFFGIPNTSDIKSTYLITMDISDDEFTISDTLTFTIPNRVPIINPVVLNL